MQWFSLHSRNFYLKKINSLDSYLQFRNRDSIWNLLVLKKYLKRLICEDKLDLKIESLKILCDLELIQGHTNYKKIYLHPKTYLPYKSLCGNSGNLLSIKINEFICDHNINIQIRKSSQNHLLADLIGKHNESGLTYYLCSSDENRDAYESLRTQLKSSGKNEIMLDEMNKLSALKFKSIMQDNDLTILNSNQVGGIGSIELLSLGIDPKIDPCDVLVYCSNKSNEIVPIKISAKNYKNPRRITYKNCGPLSFGKNFLNHSEIDKRFLELYNMFQVKIGDSLDSIEFKKSSLKQKYIEYLYKTILGLNTIQMDSLLNDIYGSNSNNWIQIINTTNWDVNYFHSSKFLMNNEKYSIDLISNKIIIKPLSKNIGFLEIRLKTETYKSPKIMFIHRDET